MELLELKNDIIYKNKYKKITIKGYGGFLCENCYNGILSKIDYNTICENDGDDVIEDRLAFRVYCSECNHTTKWEEIPIDPNILPYISLLNRKGYKTLYCCEGHGDGDKAYIIFDPKIITLDNMKEYKLLDPWEYEISHNDRLIICTTSKTSTTLSERMESLSKWVDSLPILKDSYLYNKNMRG